VAPPATGARYDGSMADNPKGKVVKSGIGVLGALATIVSVWWFALRPRSKRNGGATTEE
jgi:hypothetical protein